MRESRSPACLDQQSKPNSTLQRVDTRQPTQRSRVRRSPCRLQSATRRRLIPDWLRGSAQQQGNTRQALVARTPCSGCWALSAIKRMVEAPRHYLRIAL